MARPRRVSDVQILEVARRCALEHGPGVSLARIAREVGLSAPAIVQRFGSKDALVFRSLLPDGPPAPTRLLTLPPPADVDVPAVLVELLTELCAEFRQVGPALAAVRMAPVALDGIFPPDAPGPPVRARERLAAWLDAVHDDLPSLALADMLLGAAEARGFFAWVGPQMVSPDDDRAWARDLVAALWRGQTPLTRRSPSPP